jgi:hypothetical protein
MLHMEVWLHELDRRVEALRVERLPRPSRGWSPVAVEAYGAFAAEVQQRGWSGFNRELQHEFWFMGLQTVAYEAASREEFNALWVEIAEQVERELNTLWGRR